MINFSFSISPFVNSELEEIDKHRQKTLLTLLPPATLIGLQYAARIDRIHTNIHMLQRKISQKQVENAVSMHVSRQSETEKIVSLWDKTENHLYYSWFMSKNLITPDVLEEIHNTFSHKGISGHRKDLDLMCVFIQSNPEHPIIQAALARILLFQILGSGEIATRLGIFASWIFLLKKGYDFNLLLNPEGDFVTMTTSLEETMNNALTTKNISPFLELYTHSLLTQSEKARKLLKDYSGDKEIDSIAIKLSERQIEILRVLDKVGSKISNRQVQRMFGVSQITASRDLAGLTQLNLIYPIGKGRAAEYVKAR